jgi:hypothetical protein
MTSLGADPGGGLRGAQTAVQSFRVGVKIDVRSMHVTRCDVSQPTYSFQ